MVLSHGNSKITLKAISDGQAFIHYNGLGEDYFTSLAYNTEGKQLEASSKSYVGSGVYDQDLKDFYAGQINTIDVYIVSKIVRRQYPFVLEK